MMAQAPIVRAVNLFPARSHPARSAAGREPAATGRAARRGHRRARVTPPTPQPTPPPMPSELLELALSTAREAGDLVVRLRQQGVEVAATKSSPIDIVTEADRASESLVLDRLLGARPDDGIVGEEGSERAGTSGVVWIVDPIDGTVNYLYGLPHFAVSIAADPPTARNERIPVRGVPAPAHRNRAPGPGR